MISYFLLYHAHIVDFNYLHEMAAVKVVGQRLIHCSINHTQLVDMYKKIKVQYTEKTNTRQPAHRSSCRPILTESDLLPVAVLPLT